MTDIRASYNIEIGTQTLFSFHAITSALYNGLKPFDYIELF